jgi:hypothetical protein
VIAHIRLVAHVRHAGIIFCVGAGLSGCAIGHLSSVGGGHASDVHQGLRDRAADLSRAAWDRVVQSGSRLSAWATILMEGRSDHQSEGLAASSENAPASSYLAAKARTYNTGAEQLSAVVADIRAKTAEADSFIAFARAVNADSQQRIVALQAGPQAGEAVRLKNALVEDQRVLERTVANLRSQKVTFGEVERELRVQGPGLDTAPLKSALESFGARITRLGELAHAMDS